MIKLFFIMLMSSLKLLSSSINYIEVNSKIIELNTDRIVVFKAG